ncbi:MAG: ketosteroid isomerase [Acidobacteria bacterium]|nr:ketosteroid isomerase [Acidobacteriota bacterium]
MVDSSETRFRRPETDTGNKSCASHLGLPRHLDCLLPLAWQHKRRQRMSESNIQVVKDGFDRFLAGDIAGFLDLLSDDIYWDHRGPDGAPFNRLYEGREDVAEFFKVFNDTQEAVLFEPREFFSAGDRVVSLGFCRFRVHATKKEWESDWAMAFTIQNNKVTHWRIMFDMGREAAACQV